MKKFIKLIIHKIKNLDKNINSYKKKTGNISMPSKAYLNWGINLALEGKINDAIEKFEMSSSMPCNDPENFTNWGIALAKLHRFEDAVAKFDQALKIDKTYSSAYSLKGAALVELNRIDDALECYNYAIKYAPFDPEIYINWGVALARTGQKGKAEIQFRKALGLSLTNINAAFLLAVVLYEQNKLLEASEAFNYTLKLNNQHAMAYYYLSLTNTKLENYPAALDCAKITVQLAPFRIDFMVNLAECYYDMKDIKNTIKTYRAIEVIAPDDYSLLISAGIFWQKVKKYKKSLKYIEPAIQKPQADYLAKYYYAITLAGLNRISEAKNVLLEIIEQKPNFYDAMIKLAIMYKAYEEYDKAIEILEKIFSQSTHFSKYYNLIATCYLQKGDIEKAIEYHKKMLEYYPDNIEAHIELVQIYLMHTKDIKNAMRMIRAAYKLDKDNLKINTLFALVLAEDNSYDDALEKIDYAISLDENNLETYLRKIYILKHSNYSSMYRDYIDYVKDKFPDQIDYINSTITSY